MGCEFRPHRCEKRRKAAWQIIATPYVLIAGMLPPPPARSGFRMNLDNPFALLAGSLSLRKMSHSLDRGALLASNRLHRGPFLYNSPVKSVNFFLVTLIGAMYV